MWELCLALLRINMQHNTATHTTRKLVIKEVVLRWFKPSCPSRLLPNWAQSIILIMNVHIPCLINGPIWDTQSVSLWSVHDALFTYEIMLRCNLASRFAKWDALARWYVACFVICYNKTPINNIALSSDNLYKSIYGALRFLTSSSHSCTAMILFIHTTDNYQ